MRSRDCQSRAKRRALAALFVLGLGCGGGRTVSEPADALVLADATIDVLLDAKSDAAAIPDTVHLDADTADVHDTATPEVTNLAWPAACLPEGTTVTTIGPAADAPADCPASACAACPAPFQCTCAGDGSSPCAWQPMAPMAWPRANAAGVVADDGKFYVFGGAHGFVGNAGMPSEDPKADGVLANGEVYDPATNAWTPIPTAPIFPTQQPAIAWGGGRLYVAGGNQHGLGTVYSQAGQPPYASFDPQTALWTALPTEGSPGGCGTLDSLYWVNNQLVSLGAVGFAGGGGAYAGQPGPPARYDPVSNVWTPLPEMPPPGTEWLTPARTVAVVGTSLVWVKPVNYKPSVGVVLDGATWTWSTFAPPACAPVIQVTAIAAVGDKVAMWGRHEQGFAAQELWLWHPPTGKWTAVGVPQWVESEFDRDLFTLPGGRLLIAGMERANSQAIYDVEANMWTRLASAHGPVFGHGGQLVGLLPQQILLVGGIFNIPSSYATAVADRVFVPQL